MRQRLGSQCQIIPKDHSCARRNNHSVTGICTATDSCSSQRNKFGPQVWSTTNYCISEDLRKRHFNWKVAIFNGISMWSRLFSALKINWKRAWFAMYFVHMEETRPFLGKDLHLWTRDLIKQHICTRAKVQKVREDKKMSMLPGNPYKLWICLWHDAFASFDCSQVDQQNASRNWNYTHCSHKKSAWLALHYMSGNVWMLGGSFQWYPVTLYIIPKFSM